MMSIDTGIPVTLVPYYGGKSQRLARLIIERLPEHKIYVEPFGGAAGVLLNKAPSQIEVYNDLSDGIVALFQAVRDPELLTELGRQLALTPYSRSEWRNCQRLYLSTEFKKLSLIEKARIVYTILSQGFCGTLTNSGWSFGGTKSVNVVGTFYNSLDKLPAIHARIKNVQIEHQDALQVLRRWDSPDTCFYLDPPYVLSVRSQKSKGRKTYDHEMTDEQHRQLLDFCLTASGKILISGYRTELYDNALLPAGWVCETFTAYATSAMYTVGNGLKGRPSSLTKRTECLWISPNAQFKTLWDGMEI